MRLIPYAHTRHGIIWAIIIATAKSQTPKCWSSRGILPKNNSKVFSFFLLWVIFSELPPPTSNRHQQDYYIFSMTYPINLPLPLDPVWWGESELSPTRLLRWEPRCQDKKMRSLWVRLGWSNVWGLGEDLWKHSRTGQKGTTRKI